MKKYLLVLMFFCKTTGNFAQVPEWVDAEHRKLRYNDREYLVGFASEKNLQKENPSDLLGRLENYAKEQIAEYIQVTVKSEEALNVKQENEKFQQLYTRISTSATELVLSGIKVETYYDPKKRIGYCLAYTRRSDLLEYYKQNLNTQLNKAEQLLNQSNNLIKTNREQAYKLALEALSILPEMDQAQTVIMGIKRSAYENDIQLERVIKLQSGIESALHEINRGIANTLDDACFMLAQGLKIQTGALNAPVLISNFTYQDTRFGSELSNRITQLLGSRLVSTAGYNVVSSGTTSVGYAITGTYWKEAQEIKIMATLKEISGKIIASAQATLPMSWITTNNVRYLPENFEEAYSRIKDFDKNEIVKGDINVEIWTNKGKDNLIFTEGEHLKLYVRANKECYIRLIYHLADGHSVLLFDNYYIAAHMVNKVIEIPDEFVCSEPFGVEVLQVNAQSKPFDPLNIRKQDGYDFIESSLKEVLVNTRGFKKANTETIDKAEKKIVITTMKR